MPVTAMYASPMVCTLYTPIASDIVSKAEKSCESTRTTSLGCEAALILVKLTTSDARMKTSSNSSATW